MPSYITGMAIQGRCPWGRLEGLQIIPQTLLLTTIFRVGKEEARPIEREMADDKPEGTFFPFFPPGGPG